MKSRERWVPASTMSRSRVRTGGLSVRTEAGGGTGGGVGAGSSKDAVSHAAGLPGKAGASASGAGLSESAEVQNVRLKLDELFFMWMSKGSTQDVVRRLAKVHAEGKSVFEAVA